MWCAEALGGPHSDAYDALWRVGQTLSRLLPTRTTAFLERDALLRNLVEGERSTGAGGRLRSSIANSC